MERSGEIDCKQVKDEVHRLGQLSWASENPLLLKQESLIKQATNPLLLKAAALIIVSSKDKPSAVKD